MPGSLSILDVGHGNAAVVAVDGWTAVIDAGPGNALLLFLADRCISRVDLVLISHADEDHIGGLIALLGSGTVSVGRVRLNSDSKKGSQIWADLAAALDYDQRVGRIDFRPSLTPSDTGQLDNGDIHLEVIAPTNYLAMRGPGAVDRAGRQITSNSVSSVIRLSVGATRLALFTGDIDGIGLAELTSTGLTDLRALILVFPHHGGRPGAGAPFAAAFASQLCEMVQPDVVVFSIGRGLHSTPNPDVVRAIRATGAHIRIACTQLSERCAQAAPRTVPGHLNPAFARGRERRECCAGTLVVEFNNLGAVLPDAEQHLAFIRANAPNAICQ